MYSLLLRLFVANDGNANEYRTKCGMMSGILGIGLNILLFAGKYIAGLLSGSIAIVADAFNNLSDAGSSLITFLGFRLSVKKPDAEHPFGHGRFEYVSAFLVSVVVLIMGFELLRSSVVKIIEPEPVETGLLTVVILICSVIVKLYMYHYNSRYGRRLDSEAMRATSADSLCDAASTSVVLIATVIAKYTGVKIDGWCGVLVAVFILYSGCSSLKETIGILLGRAPSREFVDGVSGIVGLHPDILGIHDLVVHDYGPGRLLVSMHCEVDSRGDLIVLHDMIDHVERELEEKLGCEAVIHMDPLDISDERVIALREKVGAAAADICPDLKIHDFRMVTGPTHTNLIFDVLVPLDFTMQSAKLKNEIEARLNSGEEQYYCVIRIDKSYVS